MYTCQTFNEKMKDFKCLPNKQNSYFKFHTENKTPIIFLNKFLAIKHKSPTNQATNNFVVPTIMCKNYWENCEKRPSVASHKQFKTLLRANMVKLKIILLYIYKVLRLKT